MVAERENFYILLDLDPSVQDWDRIEATIVSKKSDWHRDTTTSPSPKRKRQAAQNKELLPEIERVMGDPELRQKEAEQAVERRQILRQESLQALRQDLAFLCAKGYLFDREVDNLIKRYTSQGLTEEEIRRKFSVPVRSENVEEEVKAGLLNTSILKQQIPLNLTTLGCADLYQFLGMKNDKSASCVIFRAKAAEIGAEVGRHTNKTTKVSASQELVGHCMRVFASDETRECYDQALGDKGLEKVEAKFVLLAGDTIHAQTFQLLMRIGMEACVSESRCRKHIREMARRRGMLVEVPALPLQHRDP